MEPWQSWTIVLLGSGAAWWYYNRQSKPKTKTGRAVSVSEEGQSRLSRRREDNKAKRRREGNTSAPEPSGSDIPVVPSAAASSAPTATNKQLRKRKAGKTQAEPGFVSSAIEADGSGNDALSGGAHTDDGMDNKEFAKQLSGLKTGTSLAPPAQVGSGRKPLKQSRVDGNPSTAADTNYMSSSQAMSTESSTAGMDADDDLSLTNSPAFEATSFEKNPNGGDVSDMLEAPAAGPSVLRLTDPTQQVRQRQPQQQKGFQVQETKKQRQNRQKNEEKRLAREQAEKERRFLSEKQLRTAREAEGRPAKNGMASSKPPVSNAWATPVKPTSSYGPSSAAAPTSYAAPLLDTFDKYGSSKAETSENGGGGVSAVTKAWERDLPSEEDQLRMINEMNGDDGWNTVQKGKKGKTKVGNITATNSESSDGGIASASNGLSNPLSERSGDMEGLNITNGYGSSAPSNPNDSDWAVV